MLVSMLVHRLIIGVWYYEENNHPSYNDPFCNDFSLQGLIDPLSATMSVFPEKCICRYSSWTESQIKPVPS